MTAAFVFADTVTRRHDRLPGPRHTRRAAMTTSDPFAYWELSMLLQGSDEPKVLCTEHIIGRTGYRIANCTRELDHPLPHVDCHQGKAWNSVCS